MGDERPPNVTLSSVVSHRTSASVKDELPERYSDHLPEYNNYHPWGVFFTILGTVLLDFDADACQSPARAYLLDVTIPGILIYLCHLILK